jgi:CRP/FNR family transcriptional regulator, cyclic AMP receptor protein
MPTERDNIELLGKVLLFAGLSKTDLGRISRIAKRRAYARGGVIFTENTLGKTIYIVASGRVKIFSELPGGRRKTFVYMEPGEFFGELALLCEPTRSASAQAMTDCEMLVLQQKDFIGILKSYPGVSLNLITVLCNRLREADREIEALSFYGILGRIARVLLNLDRKYGRPGPTGSCLDLPLGKKDIAELTGTVREVASRAVKQLVKFDCIKSTGSRVVILDREKLKYISGYR